MQTPNKVLVGMVVTLVTIIVCVIGIRAELEDARKPSGVALSSNHKLHDDSN